MVEDPKKKEFFVKNLREVIVESLEECMALLTLGEQNRSYAETKMNHQSSRSHAIYRMSIQSMPKMTAPANNADGPGDEAKSNNSYLGLAGGMNLQAVLNFIDLAGSERASMHENSFDGQS